MSIWSLHVHYKHYWLWKEFLLNVWTWILMLMNIKSICCAFRNNLHVCHITKHVCFLAPIPSVSCVLFCFFAVGLLLLPLSTHHDFEALPSILPILDTSITTSTTSSSSSSKSKSICTSCVCVCAHELLFVCKAVFLAQPYLYSLWVKKRCFSSWLPFSWCHLHGCVECPYRRLHTKLGCWCKCPFAGPAVNREKSYI